MRWSIRRQLRLAYSSFVNSKNYRIRFLTVACMLACLILYVIFYVILFEDAVIDTQYMNAVDEAVLNNRVDFHEMAIAKVCSNTTKRCYSVYDRKTSEDGEEEVVERHLLVDGFADESDTAVRLIPPKGENFDSSDTRIWEIHNMTISTHYVAGMLVAPFLLTSLSLNSNNSDKKVLEIGLGGGSLDMALLSRMPEVDLTSVELDPVVVDIAKRWFGVKETKSHRIVVQDGLKFVENAAKEGKRFDVVVVDACDEAIRAPCPADAFRNAEVAQMLRDVLTDTGSFVLNILSHDLEGRTTASELVKLYSSVFPACIELRFAKEVNVILACVPYSIVNIRQQLSFYNSRLTAVLSQFKLNDELGAITIV